MQRRAAAVLFVFFMVMGASAYSVIALAEEPQPNLKDAQTNANGSNFTVDGQEYQVLTSMEESSGGGGHGGGGGGPTAAGSLRWYVPNTAQNQTFENGSAAEVFNGTWLVTTGVSPNLDASYVNATGGVIPYASAAQATGGSSGNASNASGNTSGGATTGGNASAGSNSSSAAGGTSTPAANGTNGSGDASGGPANATGGNATAGNTTTTAAANTSGDSQNASNTSGGNPSGANTTGENTSAQQSSPSLYSKAPNTLVFTNTTDVTAVLQSDPAVFNETSTSDGQMFVRYRSNDTFVPLSNYLPKAEQKRVKQGETFTVQIEIETYDGTTTKNVTATVANVTNESAVIDYEAPQYNSVDLASGENITLANGEERVVNLRTEGHGNDTAVEAQFGSDYQDYKEQSATQTSFGDRMTGLWNVIMICSIAGLLVIGLAFLPVRG